MMQKFWTGADNHLNQPFQTKILIGAAAAAAVREAEEKIKISVHIRVHRGAPKKKFRRPMHFPGRKLRAAGFWIGYRNVELYERRKWQNTRSKNKTSKSMVEFR